MLAPNVGSIPVSPEDAAWHRLAELAAQMERDWPDLRKADVHPWSDVPVVALDRGRPWLVAPVERDPLARNGRTVVPAPQLRQLERIAQRNVPFQRLAIAHELDPAGPASTLVPLLANGPRTCTDDVARALVGPLPPHPGLARAARVIGSLVGAATATARTALDLLLDPIIFGVVAPSSPAHGELSLWYPLVAWRW